MTTVDTDWITPGAEIVVYRHTYSGNRHPRKTTVKTRAKQSFTVDGVEDRFRLDRMETKQTGSWSSATSWVALHPDSERARELFEQQRKERLMSRAQIAVEKWEKDRSRENRIAAIEALQAVEDD